MKKKTNLITITSKVILKKTLIVIVFLIELLLLDSIRSAQVIRYSSRILKYNTIEVCKQVTGEPTRTWIQSGWYRFSENIMFPGDDSSWTSVPFTYSDATISPDS